MILKINGVIQDPGTGSMLMNMQQMQQPDFGPMVGVGEFTQYFQAQDQLSASAEVGIWMVQKLGEVLKEAAIYLVQIGPDLATVTAMIFCLGAILGSGKYARWTINATVAGILLEVLNTGGAFQ
jgi:hypothetical protein